MPRTVRLSTRRAFQDPQSAENALYLVTITHPDLDAPIRISSDPTAMLSSEPLLFGTRSRLLGSTIDEGNLPVAADFLFVLMSAVAPEDRESGTTSTEIVFENVDSDMIDVVRSFQVPATVHFAVVLASDPDYVDLEWAGLRTVSADYDDATVTLSVSREDRMNYAWPFARMTKSRFPGLHR